MNDGLERTGNFAGRHQRGLGLVETEMVRDDGYESKPIP
jgi:hypothetical protein